MQKRTRILRIGIVAFWAVMALWLIRYEAFPDAFTNAAVGYRALFREGLLVKDTWMKIVFRGAPIGYSYTRVDLHERDPIEYCTVHNRSLLNLKIMGQGQRVQVNASASLDNTYRMQRFSFLMASRGYSLRLEGRRAGGQTFEVLVQTAAGRQKVRVEVPDDAVLYSPMTEMAMRNLKPGDSMSVKTLDPTTLTIVNVIVSALRTEPVPERADKSEATVLSVNYRGMEVLTWISPEGDMLRQETPFGWTMIACGPEEALAAEKQASGGPEDILTAMAVPVTGTIPTPRACRRLRARLYGATLGEFALDGSRQHVESRTPTNVILALSAESWPAEDESDGATPADLAPYLQPSTYIQSSHPDIVRQAQAITAGITNPAAAARAIHDWVEANVEKDPAVSIPSAVDVLRERRGDCNEHTYLFVALARAAGIPSRVTVGLTFARGAFYYHAWPAVHVSRWVEMDPTLGQPIVDATHIALLTGELADQLKLAPVFGRLRIDILEHQP